MSESAETAQPSDQTEEAEERRARLRAARDRRDRRAGIRRAAFVNALKNRDAQPESPESAPEPNRERGGDPNYRDPHAMESPESPAPDQDALYPMGYPPLERRKGKWFGPLRQQIDPPRIGPVSYAIKHLWHTRGGRWDQDGREYEIDQWARDLYLKSPSDPAYIDNGGAATHILAAVLDQNGERIDRRLRVWRIGGEESHLIRTGDKRGSFADFPIVGSNYAPQDGQIGPWAIAVNDPASEILHGIGLPNNLHVSTFVVFQAVSPGGGPPTGPPPTPPDPAIQVVTLHVSAGARLVIRGRPPVNVEILAD